MIGVTARSAASASLLLSPPPLSPVPDRRYRQLAKDKQGGGGAAPRRGAYETQKRRDWHSFRQYLRTHHRPPLEPARCSGAYVLDYLRYLDQFGKTKVHAPGCPFFGHPSPPAPCPCPLRQAWSSLDALVGRLCAAFDEHGGVPEANPFRARAVRLYLCEVRDTQAMARGIAARRRKKKSIAAGPVESTHVRLFRIRQQTVLSTDAGDAESIAEAVARPNSRVLGPEWQQ